MGSLRANKKVKRNCYNNVTGLSFILQDLFEFIGNTCVSRIDELGNNILQVKQRLAARPSIVFSLKIFACFGLPI